MAYLGFLGFYIMFLGLYQCLLGNIMFLEFLGLEQISRVSMVILGLQGRLGIQNLERVKTTIIYYGNYTRRMTLYASLNNYPHTWLLLLRRMRIKEKWSLTCMDNFSTSYYGRKKKNGMLYALPSKMFQIKIVYIITISYLLVIIYTKVIRFFKQSK